MREPILPPAEEHDRKALRRKCPSDVRLLSSRERRHGPSTRVDHVPSRTELWDLYFSSRNTPRWRRPGRRPKTTGPRRLRDDVTALVMRQEFSAVTFKPGTAPPPDRITWDRHTPKTPCWTIRHAGLYWIVMQLQVIYYTHTHILYIL